MWVGPQKHTVFYPVRGGKEFNLVLIRPDNMAPGERHIEGDVGEMRQSYEGWDETWVGPFDLPLEQFSALSVIERFHWANVPVNQ